MSKRNPEMGPEEQEILTEGFEEEKGQFIYISVLGDGHVWAKQFDGKTRESTEIPMSKIEAEERLEKLRKKLELQIKDFESEIRRKEEGLEKINKMLEILTQGK